jgi:hypothetical protein
VRDDKPAEQDGEAGVAGGESAFAFGGGRELSGWDGGPGLAVAGEQQFEFCFARFIGDGIAEDYAVGGVPEHHGVEEAFGIGVGELELPMLAAVGGVVDAGLVAGTGGHEEGLVGGESDYGAEVESGGVGDLGGDPGASGVGGAEVGAAGPGGPSDVSRDGAHAAEIFCGVGALGLASGLGQGSAGDEQDQQGAHGGNCRRKSA